VGYEFRKRDPLRHTGQIVGRLNGPKHIQSSQKMTKNKESRQKENSVFDTKKLRGSFQAFAVPTNTHIRDGKTTTPSPSNS